MPARRGRIGGEFEIDPLWLTVAQGSAQSLPAQDYFANGRGCLAGILRDVGLDSANGILVPEYVCESVIRTVVDSGFEPIFYRVRPALEVDLDGLLAAARSRRSHLAAAIFVDYFGLSECASGVSEFKNALPEIPVIRDNAQALFEMDRHGEEDYRFSSLRKWLPVPDGGRAERKDGRALVPGEDEAPFVGPKLAGNLEQFWVSRRDFAASVPPLIHSEAGETLVDDLGGAPARMSLVSRTILSHVDLDEVRARRRENFLVLANLLEAAGIAPIRDIGDDRVPMFLPVSIENRDQVRSRMRAEGVYCPAHWPVPRQLTGAVVEGRLWEHELSLIIDQRYGPEDMAVLADVLVRAIG